MCVHTGLLSKWDKNLRRTFTITWTQTDHWTQRAALQQNSETFRSQSPRLRFTMEKKKKKVRQKILKKHKLRVHFLNSFFSDFPRRKRRGEQTNTQRPPQRTNRNNAATNADWSYGSGSGFDTTRLDYTVARWKFPSMLKSSRNYAKFSLLLMDIQVR